MSLEQKSGKLKVLCLHGFRQNDVFFREKSGSLRKLVKNVAEFSFLCGPHEADPLEGLKEFDVIRPNQRGWWFSIRPGVFSSRDQVDHVYGFNESVKRVSDWCQSEGPFDGILGFSQGACLAALIVKMQQLGLIETTFRFAVIIAGFKSLAGDHAHFYDDELIKLPSLHLIGETDEIIPAFKSDALANMFENGVTVRHPGGHFVPSGSTFKEQFRDFFRQFL